MNGSEKRKARKKAQSKIPLTVCCKCGKKATDRHHPNHDEAPEVVQFCREHHLEADAELLKAEGIKGAEKRWKDHSKTRNCENCGTEFVYTRPRQTTCSRSCGNKLAWKKRGGKNRGLPSPKGCVSEAVCQIA